MAEAALWAKGLKASSHKGVISLFGEHLVKTGIFPKEMGKALNDIYDQRLIGDYGVGFSVTREEAESTLALAKNFVRQVKNYLGKLG